MADRGRRCGQNDQPCAKSRRIKQRSKSLAVSRQSDTLAAKEGAVVKVGELLVTYEGQGKSAATSSAQAPSPAPAAAQMAAPPVAMTVSGAPDTSPATRVLAAPSTRKFARESGVDLSRVAPSGPNGRVMRDDIETFTRGIGATAAGKPVPAKTAFQPNSGSVKPPSAVALARGEERIPFRGLRKKIAEKMRQSKDHAAHFTYVEEADARNWSAYATRPELGAAQGVSDLPPVYHESDGRGPAQASVAQLLAR